MKNTTKSANPVSAPEKSERQVINELEPLQFETVSVPIEFWDYEKSPEFIGVLLNRVKHEPTGLDVYLFSEYDSHKIVMIPDWHALKSLSDCENLGCTVFKLVHHGKTGKNDYHRVDVFRAKGEVESRLSELPNEYR